MLAIDLAFFFLELGTGIYVGSLALMADAFHMLNDVISLVIGLWAVRVAQNKSTDKFSYGWLRAEILGAFFNAVFLIALCVSILLEAVGRFVDPPAIKNPQMILIVGSLGLASNLAGFFVLGGHSHGHGHDHDHAHDDSHSHSHVHDSTRDAEEGRHISFDENSETTAGTSTTRFKQQHRRRASSNRHSRLPNIEDMSFHPASFRQEIIAASKPPEVSEDDSETENENDAADDHTPLIGDSASVVPEGHYGAAGNSRGHGRKRRDSGLHDHHNHNKPRETQKSGGHSHNHADMGMQAMILHVIGDALGNVGVIVTALIIWKTEWSGRFYADPAVSLFITCIILHSCIPLTLATAKILLQATPDHISIRDIKADIQDLPGVVSCHHVHIWQLSDTKLVASMHMQVSFPISEEGGEKYMKLAMRARSCLHAYGIHSATIQPEFCLDEAHASRSDIAASDEATACGASGPGSVCLLECVDDCVGQGCCSDAGAKSPPGSSHSGTAGGHNHDHGEHSHDHHH